MISENLHSEIEAAGFKIKTFRIEHLKEIRNEFKTLVEQGLLDENFYRSNLADFKYDYKSELDDAKSVIMIASPQCKSLAEFTYEGKTFNAVIPPTYMYPVINSRVTSILNGTFAEEDYSFIKASLPLKLLAARSGLGKYGRNNVCYIPGLGSFIRLAAYITDYEFQEDSWGGIKTMESCNGCTVCSDNCPTGAIDKECFLIHAQNCLTNFNEYDTPIPDWISPTWHDSIVGCMKCQSVCPHNKHLIDLVDERICFDEKETELILEGCIFDSLSTETRNKIVLAGMEPYYNVLPRNIRLLMNQL